MEKLLDPYDKECMKMAMLKHEETFKQQVYELHRLYRVQKILMKRIDATRAPHRTSTLERLNSHHHQNHQKLLSLDLEPPTAKERRTEMAGGVEEDDDEETEIELTLGPSSYYRNKKGDKRNSSSGKSFSSSSTTGSSSSHMQTGIKNRSFDVEHQQHQHHQQQQQFIINQEKLKQPSWLFQPLSLNIS